MEVHPLSLRRYSVDLKHTKIYIPQKGAHELRENESTV
jgi:hypothetical protein